MTLQALVRGQTEQIIELDEINAEGGGFIPGRPPGKSIYTLHRLYFRLSGFRFRRNSMA